MSELSMPSTSRRMFCPGETMASTDDYMRGHGTYVDAMDVVSSLVGDIERVNKLLSIKPLRARYSPQIGDLVVGRIIGLGQKRWRVEIGARTEAVLLLSSVNLPGGIQRRKDEADELQMRQMFTEGDVLVCEVQAFFADGTVASLHTRSARYGLLQHGQLVNVHPSVIKRLKSHFLTLSNGLEVTLGLNGYVWVGRAKAVQDEFEEITASGVDYDAREKISKVSSIIRRLSSEQKYVSLDNIERMM